MEEVYLEICKLREMLESKKIPFVIWEETGGGYRIDYPVAGEKRVASVIQNWCSYGGRDNLLELCGLETTAEWQLSDVVGWLNAEEVDKRIAEHYRFHKYEMDKLVQDARVVQWAMAAGGR